VLFLTVPPPQVAQTERIKVKRASDREVISPFFAGGLRTLSHDSHDERGSLFPPDSRERDEFQLDPDTSSSELGTTSAPRASDSAAPKVVRVR
jgi:hypothetical protein